MTRKERFRTETSLNVMFEDGDKRFMLSTEKNGEGDIYIMEFHGEGPVMADQFDVSEDWRSEGETWEEVFWNFDWAGAANDRRITEEEYWAGK
jgi:hypothetical protein